MLRRPELPFLSALPAFDEDPALFDPSPEWFVPGLKPALRDDEEEADDNRLGFRSLIDQPATLSKAWRTTGAERAGRRIRRAKRRHAVRSLRSYAAA